MKKLKRENLEKFIKSNIQAYHKKILGKLLDLKLTNILKRKNPYLFKAKALNTAHDLVKSIIDAHLSAQEEGIFGGFLEQLAIFVCGETYEGRKSAAEGIDMEFEKDAIKYIVSVKSGPNWGNSSQIAKMKDNFRKAKKILGTNLGKINVVSVNACCYGKDNKPDKGEYLKLCGQRFWELISGDENFYTAIIKPLGHESGKRTEKFHQEYAKIINKFTAQFSMEYCDDSGAIDWEKLVKMNSGKK